MDLVYGVYLNSYSVLRCLDRVFSPAQASEIRKVYVRLAVNAGNGRRNRWRREYVDLLCRLQTVEELLFVIGSGRIKILLQLGEILCAGALAETDDVLRILHLSYVLACDHECPAAIGILSQQRFLLLADYSRIRDN